QEDQRADKTGTPLRTGATSCMRLFLTLPAVLLMATAAPAIAQDSTVIIHAQSALDGRGGTMRNVYVVVRGGRIDRVATQKVSVPGATTIELGSATLLPGMIDAHVHPG